MADDAITVHELRKTYREVTALDGIDLTVPRASVFALLGPNGAGKTTAVAILTTLSRADSGTAIIDGVDVRTHPHQARSRLGVSGQFAAVDGILTGRENLIMVARLTGYSRRDALRRADELLERFGLADADRRAATYSGGMRRRLDLACALIAAPPVLVLDEPTTGLDPIGRTELWYTISQLVAGGTTVLLTTQYLEEADQFSDSVAVLVDGSIVARGTAGELKRDYASHTVTLVFDEPAEAARAAGHLDMAGHQPRAHGDQTIEFSADNGAQAVAIAVAELTAAGIAVAEATSAAPTLDDVFVRLTLGAQS
ncbi:putative ABC transporter, ATP-binding protein [Gordonia polyisoprenivorans VH2]|uniref:Putative ABC transporter, ATP-binding protein n=1 Tax=Gordonia polyisoprenivorans (strain DSM 44266 / VH2) TaxID=1112204 RepID=H6N1H3_GORPV|nr:ATP-binding cassette domain-containing protein [Gordonia polyisoprenivorans]AFA72184.1 putative ABC transporter, ATP-binding protein [Gordonia polyisoprenivorans VH2]